MDNKTYQLTCVLPLQTKPSTTTATGSVTTSTTTAAVATSASSLTGNNSREYLANSNSHVKNAILIGSLDLPMIHISWNVPTTTLSGISVSSLHLTNENYKPYKGVRYITKSGNMRIKMNSILASS